MSQALNRLFLLTWSAQSGGISKYYILCSCVGGLGSKRGHLAAACCSVVPDQQKTALWRNKMLQARKGKATRSHPVSESFSCSSEPLTADYLVKWRLDDPRVQMERADLLEMYPTSKCSILPAGICEVMLSWCLCGCSLSEMHHPCGWLLDRQIWLSRALES